MKGHELPGPNQRKSPGKHTATLTRKDGSVKVANAKHGHDAEGKTTWSPEQYYDQIATDEEKAKYDRKPEHKKFQREGKAKEASGAKMKSPAKHTQTKGSKLSGDERKGDTSAIHNKAHADGRLTKDHVTINKQLNKDIADRKKKAAEAATKGATEGATEAAQSASESPAKDIRQSWHYGGGGIKDPDWIKHNKNHTEGRIDSDHRKIKKEKRKEETPKDPQTNQPVDSPAKCPLLALAGPIMGMLGKKKE